MHNIYPCLHKKLAILLLHTVFLLYVPEFLYILELESVFNNEQDFKAIEYIAEPDITESFCLLNLKHLAFFLMSAVSISSTLAMYL